MNAPMKVSKVVDKVDSEEAVPRDAKPATPAPPARRRVSGRTLVQRFRFVLMLALPLAMLAGGVWWYATGGRYQTTEDAYLQQAKITIASDISGRVVTVPVSDNQKVKAGQVLFQVDPAPFGMALRQADAALASARIQVEQLKSAYHQAVANERAADDMVNYMTTEFGRQSKLVKSGNSTQATLDEARHNLEDARQKQIVAKQGIQSALAALGGNPDIPVDAHPLVLTALAARDKEAYDLARTTVRAPADGVVYQAASFKPGMYVTAGMPLFTLVETGDTWVDANFKETQLDHMRPGQPVKVVLDTYPDHPIKATVDAIGAGTGEEFALLPAQNATGNWVKVTPRIPVRLKLLNDSSKLALRAGMSASVSVDTGHERGLGSLIPFAFAHPAQ